METSMPVTEIERELEAGEPLVYRTDIYGVITHADSRFIKASGYYAGELYGKSHNIVRHPDVPSVVFMELWSAVNSGKQWTGTIKSRCKDGRFYWAHVTATPVRAVGKLTGCMLVYRKPTPSQIGEASRRYQCMIEGKEAASGVIETSAGFSWQKNQVFSLSLVSIMAVLLTAAGVAGLYFSGMRNIFLAFTMAGLALTVLAAFLLTRTKARLLNTANSAAALAFAGLDACREAADGKGDLQQQAEEPGLGENIPSANGPAWQVVRKANDITLTRARKAKGSVPLTGEAGKAVEGIVVAVKRVTGIMAEISAAPAGQSTTARQDAVAKEKAAGFTPDKSGKLARGRKPPAPAGEKVANPRPLRALKGGEDEWKDF